MQSKPYYSYKKNCQIWQDSVRITVFEHVFAGWESHLSVLFLANIENHDGCTAKKLINSVNQAVLKKLWSILNKSLFMSLLSDTSQA